MLLALARGICGHFITQPNLNLFAQLQASVWGRGNNGERERERRPWPASKVNTDLFIAIMG